MREKAPSFLATRTPPAAIQILQTSQRLRQNPSVGYAMAFLSVGIATSLQWLAADQYAGAPFLTIYPAVILTTLVGGLGSGFLAAMLAGASQWQLFIPTSHWLALFSYTFDAIICVLLIVFINTTLDLLLASVDREKLEGQQHAMLAAELHHRIQNLLTVIQAIVRFSLSGEGAVETSAIRQRLIDQLQSMALANRAITESTNGGVRLAQIIDAEIRGFESRFDVSGASGIVLDPQMTQNFSLIMHELVTNALKHGALSVPEGRVTLQVIWRSASGMIFKWREHDGPPVSPPTSSGFGGRILDAFARGFCDDVAISYAQSGFGYTLQVRPEQIGWQPTPTAQPDRTQRAAESSVLEPAMAAKSR